MRRLIRWYPVGEPVKHLEAFTFKGAPIWGGSIDKAADYDEDWKAGQALAACRAFHGAEEDIVIVTIARKRRGRDPVLAFIRSEASRFRSRNDGADGAVAAHLDIIADRIERGDMGGS